MNINSCSGDVYRQLGLECPVCWGRFNNPRILKQCLHIFCETCINKVLDHKCPLCRRDFKAAEISSFPFINNLLLELPKVILREGQEELVDIDSYSSFDDFRFCTIETKISAIENISKHMGWDNNDIKELVDFLRKDPETFRFQKEKGEIIGFIKLGISGRFYFYTGALPGKMDKVLESLVAPAVLEAMDRFKEIQFRCSKSDNSARLALEKLAKVCAYDIGVRNEFGFWDINIARAPTESSSSSAGGRPYFGGKLSASLTFYTLHNGNVNGILWTIDKIGRNMKWSRETIHLLQNNYTDHPNSFKFVERKGSFVGMLKLHDDVMSDMGALENCEEALDALIVDVFHLYLSSMSGRELSFYCSSNDWKLIRRMEGLACRVNGCLGIKEGKERHKLTLYTGSPLFS